MVKDFTWKVGETLPNTKAHSLSKLSVFEQYLDQYFETVVPSPQQPTLRITLVDGFCGGGAYQSNGATKQGSPLLFIDAVNRARVKLNDSRNNPLQIIATYYFIDLRPEHTDHLNDQLAQSSLHGHPDDHVHVVTGEFHQHYQAIVSDIKKRQSAGRSIFLLDQFGYKDVPMKVIRDIFKTLPKAEVLLTFSIDRLLNYLNDNSLAQPVYKQFGIDAAFLKMWRECKSDGEIDRIVVQRALMNMIHQRSGAAFFTPFMLFSEQDNQWMMFAHLSQHQKARDKMLGVHWSEQNSFRHYGSGSLFQLGFDRRLFTSANSLFNFSEQDREPMLGELVKELPKTIHGLANSGEVEITAVLDEIGNKTAGTNNDICDALGRAAIDGAFSVLKKDGKTKRLSARVKLTDKLILPPQRQFYLPSLKKKN